MATKKKEKTEGQPAPKKRGRPKKSATSSKGKKTQNPKAKKATQKKKKVKNATRPQIIDAAIRRNYVLEQRRGGHSYRVIAQLTIAKFKKEGLPKNYDDRYACDDVMTEIRRLHEQNQEKAQDIVDLEVVRLDAALSGIWNDVLNGHLGAIDRFLKISSRRADLLGLDAPKNLDIKSDGEKVGVMVYLPDNGRNNDG